MGGAGSAVLETLSELGLGVPTLVMGIKDQFVPQGGIDDLMRDNELDSESVVRRIREALLIKPLVDLKPLNTMAVSAKARYLTKVENLDELRLVLDFAAREKVKPFILGGGSNLLIAHNFIDRLVIQMAFSGFVVNKTDRTVELGAGEEWHEVVKRILALGWGGLENLALIPGTVGGAVVQNIGAYGAEVAQFVRSIKVYDPARDVVKEFTNENCDFAYRHSVFKTEKGSGSSPKGKASKEEYRKRDPPPSAAYKPSAFSHLALKSANASRASFSFFPLRE